MSSETKKLPKVAGTYVWRNVYAKEYNNEVAHVFTENDVLMVKFFKDGKFEPPVNLKTCYKRWWFKLPSHNLGN